MWLFYETKTLAAANPSEAILQRQLWILERRRTLMRGDILQTGVLNSLFKVVL